MSNNSLSVYCWALTFLKMSLKGSTFLRELFFLCSTCFPKISHETVFTHQYKYFHDQNAAAYFLIKIIVNADKLFIHKSIHTCIVHTKNTLGLRCISCIKKIVKFFQTLNLLEDDRIQIMLLPRPCLICWACALLAFADGFPPAVLIRGTTSPETTFPQGLHDRGISRKDDDKNQQTGSLPVQLTLSAKESADYAASAGTESERSNKTVTMSQAESTTTESAVENGTMTTKQKDNAATIELSAVEDASMSIIQKAISTMKDSKESISQATKDAAKSTDLLSDNVAINSPTGKPEGKKTTDESLTDRDVLEIRMNLTELLEETISDDESLDEAASRPLVEVTLEQEEAEEEEEEEEDREEDRLEDGRRDLPWEPLFLNSSSLQQEEDLTEEDNEEGTGGRALIKNRGKFFSSTV
jgi:hypothetical protein